MESLCIPEDELALTTLEQLLEELWKQRQRDLLAIGLTVLNTYPTLARTTAFADTLDNYKSLLPDQRRACMESPAFRIWLNQMTPLLSLGTEDALNQDIDIARQLRELPRLLTVDSAALKHPNVILLYKGAQNSGLDDIDPFLLRAVSPLFGWVDWGQKTPHTQKRGAPFYERDSAQIIEQALKQIEHVWQELATIFPKFVKTIVLLPHAKGGSLSNRHCAGVILLAIADRTPLGVEEYLVHECGHQILYALMEHTPLLSEDGPTTFVLPWSGATRHAYGYFHATYIYLLLALFYVRKLDRNPGQTETVQPRLAWVLSGLKRALPDLARLNFFTPAGRDFLDRMKHRVIPLVERYDCP